MQKQPPLTIYFDGTCSLCTAAVGRIGKSGKREQFDLRAVTDSDLPPGKDFTAAMRDVHVVDEGGRIYKGADAVLRVLDEYPHLQTLARIGRFPGIKTLVAILYRVVALTRYHIFGRK